MTQAVMLAVSMLRRKKMRYGKMPRYRQMRQVERKGMLRGEVGLVYHLDIIKIQQEAGIDQMENLLRMQKLV